jgi:cyclopropane fatty-acyl-phospholipid synthase-like methyltransferase
VDRPSIGYDRERRRSRSYSPQSAAVFDLTAASYDQIVPFFAAFGEKLVAWAGLSAGQTVLDVGTGRGALISPACRREQCDEKGFQRDGGRPGGRLGQVVP